MKWYWKLLISIGATVATAFTAGAIIYSASDTAANWINEKVLGREEIEENNNNDDELLVQIANMQQQIEALESELADKNASLGIVGENLNTIQAELDAKKTALATAESELAESEATIATLTSEKLTIEAEIAGLENEIDEITSAKEVVESDLAAKQAELEAKQAEIIEVQNNANLTIEEKNTQIADLEFDIETLITEKSDLQAQYDSLNTEYTALVSEHEAQTAELEQTKTNLQTVTTERDNLQTQVIILNNEKQNLEVQVLDLESQVDSLQSEVANLENSLNETIPDRSLLKSLLDSGKVYTTAISSTEMLATSGSSSCKGVYLINPSNYSITKLYDEGYSLEYVNVLTNGNVLLSSGSGSFYGLLFYNVITKEISELTITGNCYCYIHELKNGDVLISGNTTSLKGVYLTDIYGSKFSQIYEYGFIYREFFELSNGNVVFSSQSSNSSTNKGVLLYDCELNTVTRIYDEETYWVINYESSEGLVFLSTPMHSGLLVYDITNEIINKVDSTTTNLKVLIELSNNKFLLSSGYDSGVYLYDGNEALLSQIYNQRTRWQYDSFEDNIISLKTSYYGNGAYQDAYLYYNVITGAISETLADVQTPIVDDTEEQSLKDGNYLLQIGVNDVVVDNKIITIENGVISSEKSTIVSTVLGYDSCSINDENQIVIPVNFYNYDGTVSSLSHNVYVTYENSDDAWIVTNSSEDAVSSTFVELTDDDYLNIDLSVVEGVYDLICYSEKLVEAFTFRISLGADGSILSSETLYLATEFADGYGIFSKDNDSYFMDFTPLCSIYLEFNSDSCAWHLSFSSSNSSIFIWEKVS